MASARWRLGDGEKSMYVLRLSKPPNGSAFPSSATEALRSSGQARIRPYDEEGVDDAREGRELVRRPAVGCRTAPIVMQHASPRYNLFCRLAKRSLKLRPRLRKRCAARS